jgi:hypothetical protein
MKKEELQKQAERLQKELDDLKLLISKEDEKPSKEEWFKGICSDLKVRINTDGTIDWVDSENKWVFYDSKSDYFYVNYSLIWIVLETKYGMEYNQIQDFIKSQLLINLNWTVKTPLDQFYICG